MTNNNKSNNIDSSYNTKYFLEHTDNILNESYEDKDSFDKSKNKHIEKNYVTKVIDDICADDYDYKESPAFSKFLL